MSYRCNVCGAHRAQGLPMLQHVIERVVAHPHQPKKTRKEIAETLPVCESCSMQLTMGIPLAALRRQVARGENVAPQPVVKAPPVPYRPVYLGVPVPRKL